MPTTGRLATLWGNISRLYCRKGQFAYLLMEEGLRDCLGSKQYGICENGFTLKKSIQSYLAPIIFQDEYAAIQNSKIKTIHLLQKETARNLRFGMWLIRAPRAGIILTERLTNSLALTHVKHDAGCIVCFVSLACGHELERASIHIKSDVCKFIDTEATKCFH